MYTQCKATIKKSIFLKECFLFFFCLQRSVHCGFQGETFFRQAYSLFELRTQTILQNDVYKVSKNDTFPLSYNTTDIFHEYIFIRQ